MNYPFVPKSTAYLKPGQYWPIPLTDGRFAAGLVLQLNPTGSRSLFIAGLLDWVGKLPPTKTDVLKSDLVDHGEVHIKTIHENQGTIIGCVPRDLLNKVIPLTLHQAPGRGCRLRRGYELMGEATLEQQENLRIFSTWGYGAIRIKAEDSFVRSLPISQITES